jgi:integrase
MELDLRDRILLELDMTNALRPSELLAFRWKCFDYEASTLKIMETVYKGKIRPWGKTRKSLTVIHIPRNLSDDLERWRQVCPDPSPDAFMFANQVGGFLDTDNFRKRVLHKLARDLKLPKLTFQVIRRTIATLAQKKGTVKDVQGLMRHSRTATTTDVYMQEIPESVQSTVNSINMELRQKPAKEHRKAAKVLVAVPAVGRLKSKRGAVSIKVFGNLTPIDTKHSQREAARVC